MAEKTWVKMKRGILQPKHRDAMGVRVWLYMHMVDIADWDTGRIEKWTDKQQAEKIQMPWRTVQRQRQELAELGYIDCEQGFQCLNIVIAKWVNPRSYSGELVTEGGTQKRVPSEKNGHHGTQNSVPIPPENCVPFLIAQLKESYGVELPAELHTEEFSAAWFEWEEYRKEKKKKLTPTSVKKQIKLLAGFAPFAAAMIDKSILNGWQGLFEPDQRMMNVPAQSAGQSHNHQDGGIE